MDYLLIVLGFLFLIVGANLLIDGATGIAKRFKISDMIIGLTIVAFGTSLPEFVVTLLAALNGSTEIAITNVVGSNIVNTFLILGCSAFFLPIKSDKASRRMYVPLSLFGPIIIFLLLDIGGDSLGAYSGCILLFFFLFFLYSTVVRPVLKRKKKNLKKQVSEQAQTQAVPTTKQRNIWLSILFVLLGLALLTTGGQVLVNSAVNLAKLWGVSEAIIGLTIVAIGTSLPELATSVMAALKKNSDIALGNIIGSNIFNLFFVLGVSAVIRPLSGYDGLSIDLFVCSFGSLLVLLFIYTNRKRELMRWEGAVLMLSYFAYVFYLLSKFI